MEQRLTEEANQHAERQEKELEKEIGQRKMKKVKAFSEAIKDGDIAAKSAVGQAFRIAMLADEEMSAKYNELPSRTAQVEFKLEWCRQQRDRLRDSKRSWRQVDSNIGRYLSLGKIVQEEGGLDFQGEANVQAAINYARACVRLGGSWTMFCNMSQRRKYLYCSVRAHPVFRRTLARNRRSAAMPIGFRSRVLVRVAVCVCVGCVTCSRTLAITGPGYSPQVGHSWSTGWVVAFNWPQFSYGSLALSYGMTFCYDFVCVDINMCLCVRRYVCLCVCACACDSDMF